MSAPSERYPEPVRRLFLCGHDLPAALRAEVLARGDAAAPALIELVEDMSLYDTASEGGGDPPIFAASLLGELRAPAAVGPMVSALACRSPEELAHSTLIESLAKFGSAVVEPALARLAQPRDGDERNGLREVLAHSGARDERVLAALVDGLRENAMSGAMCLAAYGDPRALPALYDAAARHQLLEKGAGPFAGQDLIEIHDAIKALGGEATPALRAALDGVTSARAEFRRMMSAALGATLAPAPATKRVKVGRNEPCPCGSGKKYKKCCLGNADPPK